MRQCSLCLDWYPLLTANKFNQLNQQVGSLPSVCYVRQLQACHIATRKRSTLVDWMAITASQLSLTNDTLFLSSQLMDRYIDKCDNCGSDDSSSGSSVSISIEDIPYDDILSAGCALWIAAKYEDSDAPSAALMLQVISVEFTMNELVQREMIMLKAVGYRLSLPTTKTFQVIYMSSVAACSQLCSCVEYLVELSLLDAGMLTYLPSQVAASAFVWGMALVGYSYNGKYIMTVSGYEMSSIMPITVRMANLHKAACQTEEPCNITIKYMSAARDSVAFLPPLTATQEQAQFLVL